MRLEITLKSGAKVEVDVEDYSLRQSPVDGRAVSFISTPDNTKVVARSLRYIDLDELAALVEVGE